MTQNLPLADGQIVHESFFDALQEMLSSAAVGFELRRVNNTTIEIPAGAGHAQAAISIGGQYRWNTATVQLTHPGGGPGTYDVHVTSANNAANVGWIGAGGSPFSLAITAAGVPPAGVDRYRKVGEIVWDGAKITELRQAAGLPASVPPALFMPGDLKATARATAPDGWLICDGTAVSRTTYAALFAAIGTAYGNGNGSTTFNLPDLLGRMPLGAGGGHDLGDEGGAETHTLTAVQLPNHSHGISTTKTSVDGVANVAHGHIGSGVAGATNVQFGSPETELSSTQNGIRQQPNGQAHNNMPPYQVVNWMVKT